jgi:hypothetical protein
VTTSPTSTAATLTVTNPTPDAATTNVTAAQPSSLPSQTPVTAGPPQFPPK